MIKMINLLRKKQELQYKIVSNCLNNHKFWVNKMPGIAQNVKILF